MTKETIVAALLAAAFAGAHAETFVDRARVQRVEPQYETVQVPREECGSQWVTEQRAANGTNVGGAVIGGLTGGIVGNQVGKGHGREAATAVGAVIGALAGNSIAQRGDAQPVYEQREVRSCRDPSPLQAERAARARGPERTAWVGVSARRHQSARARAQGGRGERPRCHPHLSDR